MTEKEKALEFIKYLQSTDKYKQTLEQFKEYLKTAAEFDRYHVIIFSFDYMGYEFGEVFRLCDRTDNLIILTNGYPSLLSADNNEPEIIDNWNSKED
jgi:hypothetical protein